MTDKRIIDCTEEQHTKLDWAFETINNFMEANNLAVLKSRSLSLVVTFLGEGDLSNGR